MQEARIDEEVKDFCDLFMPSYITYMNNLFVNGICPFVPKGRNLTFKLDAHRQPYVYRKEREE